MKKRYKVLIGSMGVIIVLIISALFVLMNGMKEIQTIEVGELELINLDDGSYFGSFDTTRWSNTVEVKIENHRIIDIVLLDDVMISLEGLTNRLFDNVIQKQSLDIDIETGTTITSKAYLKAIENALGDK